MKNTMAEIGETDQPKYRLIFERLKEKILSGEYAQGSRLPSENDLAPKLGVSRMTIVRAVKELQQLGLVDRRVGSGTYVKARAMEVSQLFGLLIPELGQTEIFEPICQGMAAFPLAGRHSLLWGNFVVPNQPTEKIAEELCQQYISQRVAGVFFAPLGPSPAMDETNQRITSALDHANIPIVLLDRCFLPYPARSKFDLVGIDNRRTAFGAVEHLINAGARKVAFLSKPFFASTVAARIAGYREALLAHGHSLHEDLVLRADPSDEKQIRSFLSRHKPDAFLCANDQMAAKLMQTLMNLDIEIPKKIRLMGIDDVKYASLLPIPLTTQRQPCLDIGRVAMTAMLDRIQTPDQPVRDILLSCELIVRKSCGSNAAA